MVRACGGAAVGSQSACAARGPHGARTRRRPCRNRCKPRSKSRVVGFTSLLRPGLSLAACGEPLPRPPTWRRGGSGFCVPQHRGGYRWPRTMCRARRSHPVEQASSSPPSARTRTRIVLRTSCVVGLDGNRAATSAGSHQCQVVPGEGTCNNQHRGPLTGNQITVRAAPGATRFGCKSITGCRHIPPVPDRPEGSYVRLCCTRDWWSA